jgi:hypothetical protein
MEAVPRAASRLLAFWWLAWPGGAVADEVGAYFPLRVGNSWIYEERDRSDIALSRETWRLVATQSDGQAGEFHLEARIRRLDALGDADRPWEGHEYLRLAGDGLHKRFPGGRHAEIDVLLVKHPARSGTRWRDAQGLCEITDEARCSGPDDDLLECVVIVCRLGEPLATVVTSTYARGIGMVLQEIDIAQLVPRLPGADFFLPANPVGGGHSVLRLVAFDVDAR